MEYDILIKNASIIDGTGAPAFAGDTAVSGDLITAVVPGGSRELRAGRIIDGTGLYLAPGFVDIHTHSDLTALRVPTADSRILQGITTELCGNCGMSAFPIFGDRKDDFRYYLSEYVDKNDPLPYSDMNGFVSLLDEEKHSTNMAFLTGHGNLRLSAMSFRRGKPEQEEMSVMKRLLEETLQDGSFGMSSGLIYPPGSYARSEELEELCTVLRSYGGIYTTHMRNEGLQLTDSVREVIRLAEKTGVKVEISHLKEIRQECWHTAVREAVKLIADARDRGLDITFDQYPYTASASGLETNIPEHAFEGGKEKLRERLLDPRERAALRDEANESHIGRWDKIFVSRAEGASNKDFVGHSIAEIAAMTGKDPADACFDIVLSSDFQANEVNFGMCEEDIEYILSQDFGMTGSDGEAEPLDFPGVPHPRIYGTFPRIISRYVRKRGVISLEQAVRKMTGAPAERIGLTDRGKISEGMHADLVLFDYDKIEDTPDYFNPGQPCEGIRAVFVNGVLSASDGVHTGARAGRIIRRR